MNVNLPSRYSGSLLILLLPILSICLTGTSARAQLSSSEPKFAAVTLDVDKVVMPFRQRSVFQLVGVRPGQIVSIAMSYPATLAGQTVSIEPLDGGQAIVPENGLAIALDGTLAFRFRVGSAPGLYQVRVHHGSSAAALQFWALDDQHRDNAPPMLTAN